MSLKGDTRTVGLADIFQALALSTRQGTLSISSGGKEIKVYFDGTGVRLLSTGTLRHTRLGSILLEREGFSPRDLESALKIQKSTGRKLGQLLVEQGILTSDEINDCLRRQIEEEICEIFLWSNAEFNFDPGPPVEDFFDPADEGRTFELNVIRILVEAARNVDEFSVLLTRIQSSNSRFVYKKNGFPVMPDTSPFGIPLTVVGRLPDVLEEPRTLDEIADSLSIERDIAAKLIAHLIKRASVLEIAELPSLKLAPQLPPPSPPRNIWRDKAHFNITDRFCRDKLDEIVHSANTPEEAAARMTQLSDSVHDRGDDRTATSILKAALDIAPCDAALRKKAVQAFVSQWKFAEAAKLVVEGCQLQHAVAS